MGAAEWTVNSNILMPPELHSHLIHCDYKYIDKCSFKINISMHRNYHLKWCEEFDIWYEDYPVQVKPLLQLFQQIGLSEQFCCFCNSLIGHLYLFAVDFSCLVQLVFFVLLLMLLLLWNKHWLFNSKGYSIKKEYEQTHAFLADRSILMKKKIWHPGWKCRLRSLSKIQQWKMFTNRCHVMFDQFLPCKIDARFN